MATTPTDRSGILNQSFALVCGEQQNLRIPVLNGYCCDGTNCKIPVKSTLKATITGLGNITLTCLSVGGITQWRGTATDGIDTWGVIYSTRAIAFSKQTGGGACTSYSGVPGIFSCPPGFLLSGTLQGFTTVGGITIPDPGCPWNGPFSVIES